MDLIFVSKWRKKSRIQPVVFTTPFPVPRYWFRYHIYCTYWLKRKAVWRYRESRTADHANHLVIAPIGRPSTLGLSSAIMFQLYEDTRRVCYKRSNCRLVHQKEALGKQAGNFFVYHICGRNANIASLPEGKVTVHYHKFNWWLLRRDWQCWSRPLQKKEKELEVSLIAIKTESSVESGGRSITLKHVMGQTVESFGHPPWKN